MSVSRRRFLKIFLVATGSAAVAYAGFLRPLRGGWRWLAFPVLELTPTGPLNEKALSALLATTEALIDYPIEKDHYADFLRWRSENLRGHKALYERFAATVNRLANRSSGCEFTECEKAVRRKILETAFRVRAATSRLDRLRIGLLERDWWLFDLHIVRPITSLFARTDAWRLVGYDSWPGTPRGLERYTQPP